MVIGRTTNRTKTGEKRVLEYYVCGAWKNKGTLVCRSNGVRTEYADNYVLNKLEKLLRSEKLVHHLVDSIKTKQESLFAPIQKGCERYESELEKL